MLIRHEKNRCIDRRRRLPRAECSYPWSCKIGCVKHDCEVIGIEDGFDGLVLPNKTRSLTLWNTRGILPIGGTILGTSNRANPFEYKVTINGKPEVRDVSKDVIKNVQSLGLDALVVIG